MPNVQIERTCEEPDCETRLSVYNSRERCWQHEPARRYHPKVGRTRNSDRATGAMSEGPFIPPPIPSPDPDPVPEPAPDPIPVPNVPKAS